MLQLGMVAKQSLGPSAQGADHGIVLLASGHHLWSCCRVQWNQQEENVQQDACVSGLYADMHKRHLQACMHMRYFDAQTKRF